jgi:MoaA/NifB/PqqE/SkfB family radical SAM enzyme
LIPYTKLGCNIIKRWFNPQISRINMALTFRCNHRCRSCNIWQTRSNNHSEVNADEIYNILKYNHIIWTSLTGGEPTLNIQFPEILKVCLDNEPITNVITNGSQPELLEKSVKKALDGSDNLLILHCSMLGSKLRHDHMVGVEGSYEKVIETIERLKSLKKGRLKLGLEHMISSKTPGEAELVRMIAESMGVSLTYVVEQKAGYYHNSKNEIEEVKLPSRRFKLDPLQIMQSLYLSITSSKLSDKVHCVAGEYSVFIDPQCVVHPCFFLIPSTPVLYLRESGYLIKGLDHNLITSGCGRRDCVTPCESYTTALFRPWRLF